MQKQEDKMQTFLQERQVIPKCTVRVRREDEAADMKSPECQLNESGLYCKASEVKKQKKSA